MRAARRTRKGALWLMALAGLIGAASSAQAAGPWKAQVVDAATGQPLEDVVVLAYWIKYTSSVGGPAGGEFYDSEEVVTDRDGRFVIQARSTWTLNPFRDIRGPYVVIFKSGYGLWRFQGYTQWPQDPVEHRAHTQRAWKQFAGEGAVIEVPALKTREERLKFLGEASWSLVPDDRTKRLRRAKDEERAHLGLRRMYERKP